MPTVDVNLWAVLVCALASMVLGSFWYAPWSPTGKSWMKESGHSMASMDAAKKQGMAWRYLLALVGSFVLAYVLAHFLDYAGATTISEGLEGAFWAWLGFIATVGLGMVLWDGKSWKLYAILMSYQLVLMLIMGAILVSWQ